MCQDPSCFYRCVIRAPHGRDCPGVIQLLVAGARLDSSSHCNTAIYTTVTGAWTMEKGRPGGITPVKLAWCLDVFPIPETVLNHQKSRKLILALNNILRPRIPIPLKTIQSYESYKMPTKNDHCVKEKVLVKNLKELNL